MAAELVAQRIHDFLDAYDDAKLMTDKQTWKVVFRDTYFQLDQHILSEDEQIQRISLENDYGLHVRDADGNYTNILSFLSTIMPYFYVPGNYTLSAVFEPFTKAVVVYCLFKEPKTVKHTNER